MIPVFLQGSGVEAGQLPLGSDWDLAFLDGEQVPGLVKCAPKTSRKIDVANAAGLEAATLRFQGTDPGQFSLAIVVWTPEQQRALEQMLGRVAPVPGRVTYASGSYTSTSSAGQKRPASFRFYHPAAAAAGILTLVVEGVTWYEDGPVPQSKQVALDCKQALPPKKTIAGTPQINTPNRGGIPAASPPGNPAASSSKRGP